MFIFVGSSPCPMSVTEPKPEQRQERQAPDDPFGEALEARMSTQRRIADSRVESRRTERQ